MNWKLNERQKQQKAKERFFLERFLNGDGRDYQSIVEREEPDFLVTTPDGLIGLEVTELLKDEKRGGSSHKKLEQARQGGLQELADVYYTEGGWSADVDVILPCPIPPSSRGELVKRLRMARPSTVWEKKRFPMSVGDKVATFFIRALPEEVGEYKRWTVINNSVSWSRKATEEILLQKIVKKAEKLQTYKTEAERIVLLLYTNKMAGSGMFHYEPGEQPLPNHGFSEVHLLIYPEKSYRIA